LNNIPLIFQKEIYATACILGGLIYFLLLSTGIHTDWLDVISISVIFLVRIVAVRYHLTLPSLYKEQ
jgi:uncharacterized membrane protein YeiH